MHDRVRFFKIMLCSQNGENRPSLRFFECIGKFNFFSQFFIFFLNLVYNESLWYCNCCMLEQISYLGKFWFLMYGPKCSWPIKLLDFSINHRTLKLAVSQEEKMEYTGSWCVRPTVSQDWHIRFYWFLAQW